ncbi:sensor histidine kinase [Actinomadura algeriensis]|uniref:histidine kinase n=1 Tax=Actinomadura algeriensis TaxID=1679523 RepID=A0ABR9JYK3_9ACTN|nr:sensor histidine kinase [Actinomadura algeriensis]MBE1535659.1 signal transduction histidine kinase [Actinomadura algeriensis]
MDEPEARGTVAPRVARSRLIGLDAAAALLYVFVLTSAARPDVPVAAALLFPTSGLPLAVRRVWPVPVFAVVFAASTLTLFLGLPPDAYVAAAYALYTVAVTRRRHRWIPTTFIGVLSGVVILGAALAGPLGGQAKRSAVFLLGLAVLGASWALGRAVRDRREHAARFARELADRAVGEERLRIARELHDIVAHSMSLIAVKSGVAVHVAEARPAEAVDALRVIEATSRGTLAEMRHLLGVLRADAAGDGDLVPAPGLTALDGLAERAAMAGVRVDLDVRAGDVPEGVALAVYRIVQEAVTNVVKHAAPARCRVRVDTGGGRVAIDVTDDGPGVRVLPGGPGEGHGIIGMRERVMMYGGEFGAGPRPEGGFAVTARFPYET